MVMRLRPCTKTEYTPHTHPTLVLLLHCGLRAVCCVLCAVCCVLPLGIGRHVLLHCCCSAEVGRSVGAWWAVGARWWRLARSLRSPPEIVGVRKKERTFRRFLPRPKSSRTSQMLLAYRYTAVPAAALLYCCSGLVGRSWVGGGCTRWWLAGWSIVS